MKLPRRGGQPTKMNWDNIKTIAQFDGEIEGIKSHVPRGNIDGTSSNRFKRGNSHDLTAVKPSTSTSLLIESLIQFICLILESDTNLANQTYKAICEQLHNINLIDDSFSMNEFEEMRSEYQMQIYKIFCAVKGDDIPISLPSVGKQGQSVETCWSRYRREFDEISFIAGGGFGKVFKARHKLDCIEYAVKQIKINSTTIKLCHLAEVKTIASLNHPNIVQYKAAWLEPYVPKYNSMKTVESDNDITEYEKSYSSSEISSIDNTSNHQDSESSDFILFEGSKSNFQSETDSSSRKKAVCKYESNKSLQNFYHKPKLAILYIQMSLCQITLQKWLSERNSSINFEDYYVRFFKNGFESCHIDVVNDIFCQILSGLNYIHSRNIVHHDVKPSNIFLGLESDGKIIVQLGDFGLACPLQNAHRGIALGTPLYAAPEQLNGECNPKSDIYSLGIVLIELLLKFNTNMERVRTIEKARKGELPVELSKQSSKLLKSLLSNEKVRPNTKELLEAIRVINLEQNLRALRISEVDLKLKDITINEMKREITALRENNTQQEMKIRELLQELEKKDEQIRKLSLLLHSKNGEAVEETVNIEKCPD